MKKILFISLILLFSCFSIMSNAAVTNSSDYSNVKVYVFYNDENETYNEEKRRLEENINIRSEFINVNENIDLFNKVTDALKIGNDKLPVTVIGSTYFIEFDKKVQTNIEQAIKAYEEAEKYEDIVEKIRNNEDVKDIVKENEKVYKQPNTANILLSVILVIITLFLIIFILIVLKKKRAKHSQH